MNDFNKIKAMKQGGISAMKRDERILATSLLDWYPVLIL